MYEISFSLSAPSSDRTRRCRGRGTARSVYRRTVGHLRDGIAAELEHHLDLARQRLQFLDPGVFSVPRQAGRLASASVKAQRDQLRVKALVEATPISGPARVISATSDSRTSELSGTLHTTRLPM